MLTFLPYKAAERTPRTAPAYSASRALDSIDMSKCSLDMHTKKNWEALRSIIKLRAIQNIYAYVLLN